MEPFAILDEKNDKHRLADGLKSFLSFRENKTMWRRGVFWGGLLYLANCRVGMESDQLANAPSSSAEGLLQVKETC